MSDYITTYSKIHFWPLDARPEDIREEDIAHALSLMTRANGHFPEFYSVGQHCIACCHEAEARGYSDEVILACLLHDAAEAYMSDVTRPIKKYMTEYKKAENHLLDQIYEKFIGRNLTGEEKSLIKEIDDALLYHEFYHYMQEKTGLAQELLSHPVFAFRNFSDVEEEYLHLLHKYVSQMVIS